ncbi:MAG: 30S ribosomal protein S8 [Candidatus Nanoarchaeia archaeon]|nr:30S ribosomal protein S8 [Candidatus Nanoarchaeia archaeon]
MSMNDTISASLSKMLNAELAIKKTVELKYISKLLKEVLSLFQDLGYIGDFVEEDTNTGVALSVNLLGNINNCGAIKPRYPVKVTEILKFEKRYLPSRNVGYLLVSTSKGLMTHKQAIKEGLGGILVAYVY